MDGESGGIIVGVLFFHHGRARELRLCYRDVAHILGRRLLVHVHDLHAVQGHPSFLPNFTPLRNIHKDIGRNPRQQSWVAMVI
jgi:hypothetical protein